MGCREVGWWAERRPTCVGGCYLGKDRHPSSRADDGLGALFTGLCEHLHALECAQLSRHHDVLQLGAIGQLAAGQRSTIDSQGCDIDDLPRGSDRESEDDSIFEHPEFNLSARV